MNIRAFTRMNIRWLGLAIVILLLAGNFAQAQEMPPPHKSPRVPVKREALPAGEKSASLRSRDVKGPATILDGEHLRIGNVDLRLFGVVPPQLAASFGPQARMALDELTRGQEVNCHVRDRDHDGRFLANCATVTTNADLALELLKRGLAVTARGSIQPTEFAAPYAAAEQAAEAQKLGLWSVTPPPAAQVAATPPPVPAAKTDNANVPPLPSEIKKEEKSSAPPPKPVIISAPASPVHAEQPGKVPTSALTAIDAPPMSLRDDGAGIPGFFARYQLFLTGLVMLMTALGILAVLTIERRRDRRDEMRAIAAALRGELLAARAVCQARIKSWAETDERNIVWPRIRSTLYQAYVGRLGWLGAVLARQIASIYGQASDYGAYFNPAGGAVEPREAVSKRQALQTLVQHIEEVLPKLLAVEQSGARPHGGYPPRPASHMPPPGESASHHAGHASEEAHAYDPAVVAPPRSPAAPLWNMVKKFTRARRPENKPAAEEPLPDYTTLIEEEMARMSAEVESETPPSNVTKMRSGG